VRETNDPAPREEKADHYDHGDHDPNDGRAGQRVGGGGGVGGGVGGGGGAGDGGGTGQTKDCHEGQDAESDCKHVVESANRVSILFDTEV